MTGLALLLCIAGFGLFGLSTDEHHDRRLGGRPSARTKRRLRAAAWVALAAALPPAVAAQGWVYGPVLWCGAVMAGAATAFLALNFAPVREVQPKNGDRT